MSDVTETLQELLERRLRELGQRRGRGESISLREAWMRLPEDESGQRQPSYETFRRIRQDGHTNITDETASALATMLDVPVDLVFEAARIAPLLGRFELPSRADRLEPTERKAVLAVVDAILEASERGPRASARLTSEPADWGTVSEIQERRARGEGRPVAQEDEDAEAARDVGREGSVTQRRRDQDYAAHPPADDPTDLEPR